ncbi:MAG: hypothetical protein PW845_18645 [Pseudomonas sp.]|uniref:hypothetical protein n=1 Tax=Pseudomonas abieticivorans TaxID=2931382 RepID=UPI0020C05E85|nr:hypothetical protein [Pseudomonas sp. PIA16]MDE1167334.1 hypothetical protein [Pseudomonas sp.]
MPDQTREMHQWNQRWVLNGDHLQCATCAICQWPWNAGVPFRHAEGCALKPAQAQFPWKELALIMGRRVQANDD